MKRKEKEKDMEERLLNTSEMIKITGVKATKLRYLHERGKVVPARITESGYRYYKQSQVLDILKETKQCTVIVYDADNNLNCSEKELKERVVKVTEEVRNYIKDMKITPIYDMWTGNIKNSNMLKVIKQAAKRQVVKIVVPDKEKFIIGDYNEFKRWFSYLECELLDLEDLRHREEKDNAD